MAKLVEPAIYRSGVWYVACLRCGMQVGIANTGSSVTLLYDVERCQQSECSCWLHQDGPVCCCSFDDLRRAINGLPLPH